MTQDGILGHLGTLLCHVQPNVNQYPQVHFLYTLLEILCLKPVMLPGVVVAQVQDPALGNVRLHSICLSPEISLSRSLYRALLTPDKLTHNSSMVRKAPGIMGGEKLGFREAVSY